MDEVAGCLLVSQIVVRVVLALLLVLDVWDLAWIAVIDWSLSEVSMVLLARRELHRMLLLLWIVVI